MIKLSSNLLLLTICGWLSSYAFGQVSTVTYSTPTADAMVVSGGVAAENFGSARVMDVYHDSSQEIPVIFRSFIQFDLSAIPVDAIIVSAQLKLAAKSVDGDEKEHPLYIERVNGERWTESEITWNMQPPVVTADQIAIPHSEVSVLDVHSLNVKEHVQQMVAHPDLNKGWRIRLQEEQSSVDFGLEYHTKEAAAPENRPQLVIEYMLPVEFNTTVNHCTAGATDGTLSAFLSGGSTYGLSNIFFYKTVKSEVNEGEATIVNAKITNSVAYNAATGEVTAENLEPGIYILRVLDAEYYENSDQRFAFYRHILVGREGEVTSAIFYPDYRYQDNVTIGKDKLTAANPVDRANTNYYAHVSVTALRASDVPNVYEHASLIQYKADFDDQLEFTKADLRMKAWGKFYRSNSSSNALTYSRVTSPWDERIVTWNSRPGVDAVTSITIPQTPTNGYERTHIFDTLNLLPFITHWQEYPNENHGIELALETYGAARYAQRSYKSASQRYNYLELEWEVKPKSILADVEVITSTGQVNVTVEGGTPPFSYLWSNGSRNEDQTDLATGVYWLKITDAAGETLRKEISLENDFAPGDMVCSQLVGSSLTHLSGCLNSAGDPVGGAKINLNADAVLTDENGWVEYKVDDNTVKRGFGFATSFSYAGDYAGIIHGFVLEEENIYKVLNSVIDYANPIAAGGYDILKVEKINDHIYLFNDGEELGHYKIERGTELDLYPIGVVSEMAELEGVRFGEVQKDFESEPCVLTFSLTDVHDNTLPQDFDEVINYCPEEQYQIEVSGATYYRWLPETGLSCYDCNNPVIEDGAAGTYVLRAYDSYVDYLTITNFCAEKSISVSRNEGCKTLACAATVEMIPEQDTYCPGDVIQLMADGIGLDYIEWTPASDLNCTTCLNPQFTVPSENTVIVLTIYNTPDYTPGEQEDICMQYTFPIVVDQTCNDNEGLSFNNFGSNVWVEEQHEASEFNNAHLNIYCNYLNEKVMLTIGEEEVPTSGKVINEGTIKVRNNWTNNGETPVMSVESEGIPGAGEHFEDGNVILFGGHQLIQGVEPTGFYLLDLTGTGKKEMYVDTYVREDLDLNHIELATRDNVLFVLNTANTAVDNNDDFGFVSSNLEGGYFSWEMVPELPYVMPTGSSIGGVRYKPLEVKINAGEAANPVKVRLVNYNPVFNGLELLAPDVSLISDEYFYYIVPADGEEESIASLAFHYNSVVDGDYQHIAHWDNVWAVAEFGEARWQKTTDISSAPLVYVVNDKKITTTNWNYFDGKEFVLAKAGFVIDFDDFGDDGDGEDDESGDVVIEIIDAPGGSPGEGGGLETTHETGGETGGEVFTPSPVEGVYHILVDELCGIDGVIEFEVNTSGNIVPNSIYYRIGETTYPLAEDLYALVETGDGGEGLLELFSIPDIKYQCDNNISLNFSDGMVLFNGEALNVGTPVGVDVNNIKIYDASGTELASLDDVTSWTATGMDEGIYKVKVTINDGVASTAINGVFIIKNP